MDTFFSPYHQTTSKRKAVLIQKKSLLRWVSWLIKKVYAAGGVTIDNLLQLKERGFGGAVLYGEIWNRFNIFSNQDYKDLINHFRKLKKIID